MWNELNIRLTKCSQCNSCNPVYIPVGQASGFPLLPASLLGKDNIICNESGIHLLFELCARKWISIFPKRFILLQKRSWLSLVVAVISPNWVQSGLGIWCRQRELCLPETKKLIYIRMGWRLRPLRVLWIWGIKHNGFHVGLSFTSPLLERGTQSWEQIWFIPRLKNWHMHVPEGSHSAKHMHTTHAHICYACIYLNSSSPGWAMVPKLSELKCLLSSPSVYLWRFYTSISHCSGFWNMEPRKSSKPQTNTMHDTASVVWDKVEPSEIKSGGFFL